MFESELSPLLSLLLRFAPVLAAPSVAHFLDTALGSAYEPTCERAKSHARMSFSEREGGRQSQPTNEASAERLISVEWIVLGRAKRQSRADS